MTTKKTKSTIKKLEKISGVKLTLGTYLLSIRKGEDQTQLELADVLNITKQYLSDIENGRRIVSPKTAAEYARKLGYSEKQFIRLALQDLLDRDSLMYCVELKDVA